MVLDCTGLSVGNSCWIFHVLPSRAANQALSLGVVFFLIDLDSATLSLRWSLVALKRPFWVGLYDDEGLDCWGNYRDVGRLRRDLERSTTWLKGSRVGGSFANCQHYPFFSDTFNVDYAMSCFMSLLFSLSCTGAFECCQQYWLGIKIDRFRELYLQ